MATNPMHQFNVYKIGPEIKIAGVDIFYKCKFIYGYQCSFNLPICSLGLKKKD